MLTEAELIPQRHHVWQ